jgi:hypothetical protein
MTVSDPRDPRELPPMMDITPEPPPFIEEAEPDLPAEEAAPVVSRGRAAALIGGRIGAGIVSLAVAALVIGSASALPLPVATAQSPSMVVDPVGTAQQIVCPGAALRLANAAGQKADVVSALGVPSIRSGASRGSVNSKAVSISDASTGGKAGAPTVLSTAPAPAGQTSPLLISGAQSQAVATPEFFGLASTGCVAASGDSWLVGGSTAIGRTTLLSLSNPTDVAATVTLQIWGENGAITAPGMTGIVVAPDGQRVLSLAGFAQKLNSPVLHVVSRGGLVVAALQQSTVRGVEPGGLDLSEAGNAPARSVVIPGVVIAHAVGVQKRLGEAGFEDLASTLRMFLPGSAPTTAEVTVIPENGGSKGKSTSVQLQQGTVQDLALDQLSDGDYTVIIEAQAPIVAALRTSTASSAAHAPPTDFAWLSSSVPLHAPTLVTIAPDAAAKLHVQNPSAKAITVALTGFGAPDVTLKVPATSSAAVTVVPGASYRISGFTSIYASVSSVTDGGVAGYGVAPQGRSSSAIRIYP